MAQAEFDIIRRYFSSIAEQSLAKNANSAVSLGIGDDAAIISPSGKPLVVATDSLVAGVHFPADFPAQAVASRALGVNLSDFAAMGATPRWLTMAISLPAIDEQWLGEFSKGFADICCQHALTLVGGDTTRAPLAITLTVIGEAEGGYLTRNGAKAGDDIWVSGYLGKGGAALSLLQQGIDPVQAAWPGSEEDFAALLQSFYAPQARLALGQGLVGLASAAIDISDGLLADASHIAEQSSVLLEIDAASLPRHPALANHPDREQVRQWICSGGDEYELLFVAPAANTGAIQSLSRHLAVPLTRIGRVSEAVGEDKGQARLHGAGWPVQGATGYSHF